jgi:hypothetical protein
MSMAGTGPSSSSETMKNDASFIFVSSFGPQLVGERIGSQLQAVHRAGRAAVGVGPLAPHHPQRLQRPAVQFELRRSALAVLGNQLVSAGDLPLFSMDQ